jgi:predicted enzyme related to lactoylglutathione lyase
MYNSASQTLDSVARAPLHWQAVGPWEFALCAKLDPVMRPYWLVSDIEAALAAVVQAGGEIAHPPMEIPGHGTFAIYLQGGNNHGLWQI